MAIADLHAVIEFRRLDTPRRWPSGWHFDTFTLLNVQLYRGQAGRSTTGQLDDRMPWFSILRKFAKLSMVDWAGPFSASVSLRQCCAMADHRHSGATAYSHRYSGVNGVNKQVGGPAPSLN